MEFDYLPRSAAFSTSGHFGFLEEVIWHLFTQPPGD
jgi:hypothetical protein